MRKCKCAQCGAEANVDDSIVLTSNPPQYNYSCPVCKSTGHVLCSDAYICTIDCDTVCDGIVPVTRSNIELRRWEKIERLSSTTTTQKDIINKINEIIDVLNIAGKLY